VWRPAKSNPSRGPSRILRNREKKKQLAEFNSFDSLGGGGLIEGFVERKKQKKKKIKILRHCQWTRRGEGEGEGRAKLGTSNGVSENVLLY
jgi:hypothetical protein